MFWNRTKKVRPVIGGSAWARELCEAFDENPGDVQCITLRAHASEAVVVTIEKFVDKDNRRVIKLVRKLAWREEK